MWTELKDILLILSDLYICWILTIEYFFDKKMYESKRRNIKRTKNKVRIELQDGQPVIIEKPKEIDVIFEHKESQN